MIFCPKCKSEIDSDSRFCDQCGQELFYCTRCGRVGKGLRCIFCGSKMSRYDDMGDTMSMIEASKRPIVTKRETIMAAAMGVSQRRHPSPHPRQRQPAPASGRYRWCHSGASQGYLPGASGFMPVHQRYACAAQLLYAGRMEHHRQGVEQRHLRQWPQDNDRRGCTAFQRRPCGAGQCRIPCGDKQID